MCGSFPGCLSRCNRSLPPTQGPPDSYISLTWTTCFLGACVSIHPLGSGSSEHAPYIDALVDTLPKLNAVLMPPPPTTFQPQRKHLLSSRILSLDTWSNAKINSLWRKITMISISTNFQPNAQHSRKTYTYPISQAY